MIVQDGPVNWVWHLCKLSNAKTRKKALECFLLFGGRSPRKEIEEFFGDQELSFWSRLVQGCLYFVPTSSSFPFVVGVLSG
jgi:hypothetical protein